MKRQGKTPQGKKRVAPRSPKTVEIVGLVEAISSDLGSGNGVYLGQGIARLLADVYRQRRGAIPAWVKQLATHYTDRERES